MTRSATALREELAPLLGAAPATLGAAMGAQLGAPSTASLHARIRGLSTPGLRLRAVGGSTIEFLIIVPVSTDESRQLEAFVTEAWGPAPWLDATRHTRAYVEFPADVFRLVVERYVPVATWLALPNDPARAATVPAWVVGQPREMLAAWVGARPSAWGMYTEEGGELSWCDVGPGPLGRGRTLLQARIVDDHVVGLAATVETDRTAPDDPRAVLQRALEAELQRSLEAMLGPPRRATDTAQRRLVWPATRPVVELTLEDASFTLTLDGAGL